MSSPDRFLATASIHPIKPRRSPNCGHVYIDAGGSVTFHFQWFSQICCQRFIYWAHLQKFEPDEHCHNQANKFVFRIQIVQVKNFGFSSALITAKVLSGTMTSDAKLERLQRNDPRMTDLDLWLNGPSDIGKITKVLQDNGTVTSASILYTCQADLLDQQIAIEKTGNGTPTRTSYRKLLVSLLESLGSIPTLRKICITGPTSQNNGFPIEALAVVLKCARHCKRFSFARLTTSGSEEAFNELTQSIQRHPQLEEIYLNGTIVAGGSLGRQKSQQQLLLSINA